MKYISSRKSWRELCFNHSWLQLLIIRWPKLQPECRSARRWTHRPKKTYPNMTVREDVGQPPNALLCIIPAPHWSSFLLQLCTFSKKFKQNLQPWKLLWWVVRSVTNPEMSCSWKATFVSNSWPQGGKKARKALKSRSFLQRYQNFFKQLQLRRFCLFNYFSFLSRSPYFTSINKCFSKYSSINQGNQ